MVVNADLDLVVSSSRDGTCIIHTLQKGRYVRSISPPGVSDNIKPALLIFLFSHSFHALSRFSAILKMRYIASKCTQSEDKQHLEHALKILCYLHVAGQPNSEHCARQYGRYCSVQ